MNKAFLRLQILKPTTLRCSRRNGHYGDCQFEHPGGKVYSVDDCKATRILEDYPEPILSWEIHFDQDPKAKMPWIAASPGEAFRAGSLDSALSIIGDRVEKELY
jgi:hypothetical protein